MVNQNNETEADVNSAKKSGIGIFGLFSVLVVAAIAGICFPIFLPDLFASATAPEDPKSPAALNQLKNGMTYISFGEVTVNLDEGRMNRYLRIKMSLQVREHDQSNVKQLLEKKQLILKNWLLSHLSDKTLDEIRGKAGQNILRRELRTYFNSALFVDGQEKIYDILFEEFNVQ